MKIAGAILAFWYVGQLPGFSIGMLQHFRPNIPLIVLLIPMIVPILIGLALFNFPGAIVNRVIAGSDLPGGVSSVRVIEGAALRLIGFYFVIEAATTLAFVASGYFFLNHMTDGLSAPQPFWATRNPATIASSLVQLAFAIWLILKSNGIVRALEKLRGDRSEPASTESGS